MCIFKFLGLCLFCFLNICLKYVYIEMNWDTRLDEALCGIFRVKEESRKLEFVCGVYPKTLTIHQTLVTVSVCNSSWWHLVKAIDHQKSRKQLKGAGNALVLLSRFCLKVSWCVHSTKQVKFFFRFPQPVGTQLHQICQLGLCKKMKSLAQWLKVPVPQGSMPPHFSPLFSFFWGLLKFYLFSVNAVWCICSFSP